MVEAVQADFRRLGSELLRHARRGESQGFPASRAVVAARHYQNVLVALNCQDFRWVVAAEAEHQDHLPVVAASSDHPRPSEAEAVHQDHLRAAACPVHQRLRDLLVRDRLGELLRRFASQDLPAATL